MYHEHKSNFDDGIVLLLSASKKEIKNKHLTVTGLIAIPAFPDQNTTLLIVFLLATQAIFQCCRFFCNLSSLAVTLIPFNKM